MPRKAKAYRVRKVARWLEWRCGAKWQLAVLADTGLYQPDEHEELVDSFISKDGPVDKQQIKAKLEQFSLDKLGLLAAAAERKAILFRSGRPWRAYYDPKLIADVEGLTERPMPLRDACKRLVKYRERYRGVTAETLRKRYLRAKRSLP
jgi:hypothetical protein